MPGSQDIQHIIVKLSDQSPSGFAVAFHIRFTTAEYVFQTYSKAWIDIYSQNGYVMQDPTVAWGFHNVGAIRWSELADQDPMEIYQKAKPFGLVYGFACAVENGGTRSVAGFARADREFTDAEIASIQADVCDLHTKTAGLGAMSPDLREELRQMSVQYTHP